MQKIMHPITAWFFVYGLALAVALTPCAAQTNNSTRSSSIGKATIITKPGCQRQCGNLTVPYPFGIGLGSGCAIDTFFEINCNTSFNPPRLFIGDSELRIYDIGDSQLRISNVMARKCYNQSGAVTADIPAWINLLTSPFSFSEANKFTVIGCDDVALVSTSAGLGFASGCISLCSRNEEVNNGSCSGNGCCQTSVPKGVRFYLVNLSSLRNHTQVFSFNPCSYGFIGEQDSFMFRGVSDFMDQNFVRSTLANVRVVLDWALGNQSCSVAQKENDYACRVNSYCVDSDTGFGGYRCNCNAGYEGNPYLDPGCHDIDECGDPDTNTCERICMNTLGSYNCSCPRGYFGDGRKDGSGCIAYKKGFPLIIGIAASFAVLLLVSASFVSYKLLKRRREKKIKEKFFKRNGGILLKRQLSTDDCIIQKTRIFTARECEKATDNFNEDRVLGRGGQGTVYKGMLTDGRIVAIKRSQLVDESQLQQFMNEVVLLSQVVHKNVVKLLGCCLETEVPLLVYEFIPNGTLFDLIHCENDEFLTWNVRLRIATEIAGALAYLHSAISSPIYHRDIKSSNILLDEKYIAKVSDFGTSMVIGIDKTHVTTLVKGTFGYLDPEYFQSNQFTEKSDVYSLGVVLAELLTRKKAISSTKASGQDSKISLATYFLESMEENCLDTILDVQIIDRNSAKEIIDVAKLTQLCLNLNGKKRPSMKEVANELERIRTSKTNPSIQANFESLGCILEESTMFSVTNSTWTIESSTLGLTLESHPLIFNTV